MKEEQLLRVRFYFRYAAAQERQIRLWCPRSRKPMKAYNPYSDNVAERAMPMDVKIMWKKTTWKKDRFTKQR